MHRSTNLNGSSPKEPFNLQLLKWIGNKQRYAHEIVSHFPEKFGTYYEPFLGSGAVLATLAPKKAVGSDIFEPLIQIWQTLKSSPDLLKQWYTERWHIITSGNKVLEYERIKASYNSKPNGADLLFLCRTCYGGVVRFRKSDGYFSTPCGVHPPMRPETFSQRVDKWNSRLSGAIFKRMSYEKAMKRAQPRDLIYCDPPYFHSPPILYGSHTFELNRLFEEITQCKERGVYVALSIDGTKQSGNLVCNIPIPKGLFVQEIIINRGQSMLRRFQMGSLSIQGEAVADRLLLTY